MTDYIINIDGDQWYAGKVLYLNGIQERVPEGLEYLDHESGHWLPAPVWSHVYTLHRWPITKDEAKTALFCQCHEIVVPDGFEVAGFGPFTEIEVLDGLFWLGIGGVSVSKMYLPSPILRKVEEKCEHPRDEWAIGEIDIKCDNCGMVRPMKLGKWEKADE